MDYNLAGLRNRVLVDKLDDDEFDPDIVDRFINDTHRDIFNQFELPFQEKIFSGVIPAGSTMFQFPSDVAQVQSQTMKGIAGFADRKMDWRDFFRIYTDVENETAGEPLKWTLYAQNMVFNCPTDQDYTLKLFYIRKPKTLSDGGDVPEIPEEFSELLVLGAFRRILERNEDYDLATTINAQYQSQLMEMVSRYGFRQASGPIKMKNQQI